MVHYIKKIAQDIVNAASISPPDGAKMFGLARVLAEEMDRLDPRDFLPAAQYELGGHRVRL